MFDLDTIENDWKLNSFCLSDEEIFDIFKSEGATLAAYNEEMDLFRANLPRKYSAEDRLLAYIFHDDEKLDEIRKADEEAREMYETHCPKKKYLSKDSQLKVIEGSMDVVFNNARYWFSYFNEKVSMEKIYYICLYALFDSAKYCVHYSTKPCFRAYVSKAIRRSIIKNIAKWEHISFREAYYIINNLGQFKEYYNPNYGTEFKFDYEMEIPTKSSFIYDKIKNDSYEIDFVGNISSNDFMKDYMKALDELTFDERKVMELLFDPYGSLDMSLRQVSEFLVVEPEIVRALKKSAFKKLNSNSIFDKYKSE